MKESAGIDRKNVQGDQTRKLERFHKCIEQKNKFFKGMGDNKQN